MTNLNPVERETIWLLASYGMSISRVAKAMLCSRATVYNRMRNIENKTGLDPANFWGLKALLERYEITDGVGGADD